MKATGIVRRIDDLGRVVVPKEIRRTLRIREGDPMEIFTNHDGEVILKKYSPIGEMDGIAKQYAESLAKISGCKVLISDRDQVIAATGGAKKSNIGKTISSQLEDLMEDRGTLSTEEGKKSIPIIEGDEEEITGQVVCPILCEGDVIGSVVIEGKDDKNTISAVEYKMAAVAASFLGRQMEA